MLRRFSSDSEHKELMKKQKFCRNEWRVNEGAIW